MRLAPLLICTTFLFSCESGSRAADQEVDVAGAGPDLEAERAAIDATRDAFELAIKEKRYADLKRYATPDFEGVSPGSADWMEYKRLREAPMGRFSYDSIVMSPRETVIASDTLAYDYGTSKVYYTDANGLAVELEDTYLVILRKDLAENQWKIHREVASAVVE